jgi:dethiobiotin synthetase
MNRPSLYITGTDTGAGKTEVSAALLRGLASAGLRAAGLKPVASGCTWRDGRWQNDDALSLLDASMSGLDYAMVNPVALPEATAPEIAARLAGVALTLPPLVEAHRQLAARADIVLVEGVGGWLAPLSEQLMQSELVKEMELPVVLVIGLRLGCINHALLSERAVQADGCRLLGWIGSAVEAQMAFAGEYLEILHRRLEVPCLGVLGHAEAELDAAPLLRALRGAPTPADAG